MTSFDFICSEVFGATSSDFDILDDLEELGVDIDTVVQNTLQGGDDVSLNAFISSAFNLLGDVYADNIMKKYDIEDSDETEELRTSIIEWVDESTYIDRGFSEYPKEDDWFDEDNEYNKPYEDKLKKEDN